MSTTQTSGKSGHYGSADACAAPSPRLVSLVETALDVCAKPDRSVDQEAVIAMVRRHLTPADDAELTQLGLHALAEEVLAEVRQSSDRSGQVGA